MMQHYEVLRAQMLIDEGEGILKHRNISVGILISQGIIAWSKLWGRLDQDMKTGSLVSEQAPDSGSEARCSCDMESELRNILVNITLQHVHNERRQAKEGKI
jgi:hypothetical protein